MTYNKIGLTKVLKYNFADIVTGDFAKKSFLWKLFRFLCFCQLFWANPSNVILASKTIRQTPKIIRQTGKSVKLL